MRRPNLASLPTCMAVAALAPMLLAAPAGPATAMPADPATVEAAVPALERYIEAFMAEAGIPGVAIGIVAGDRLLHTAGFGTRKAGTEAPVDADTLFQIGSITKSFAAGTEAVLVDRGLLAWEDRVIDHLPDFRMYDPWVTREFQVIDLLAQRSGMTPYALGEMAILGYSREQMVEAIRHLEPITSFRSSFGYQNVLHLVAEQLVMKLGGTESWEAFLRQALLEPAGMTHTSNEAAVIAASDNHASGHARNRGSVHPIPFLPEFYEMGAAGNINSNITDMARWLRLQINRGELDGRRIVGEEALTHTWRPQISVSATESYASGLVARSDAAGRVVWHNGGTAGFASFLGFDPDRKLGIVVLTNLALAGAGDAIGNRFLDMVRGLPETDHAAKLLDIVHEQDEALERALAGPASPRPEPRPAEAYAGVYENAYLGRALVSPLPLGEFRLTVGPKAWPLRLSPWNGDTFALHFPDPAELGMADPMGLVQFQPDLAGGIAGFVLQPDITATAVTDGARFNRQQDPE